MPSREGIREGIRCILTGKLREGISEDYVEGLIAEWQNSQGVVIKVDRELPQVCEEAKGDRMFVVGFVSALAEAVKAGYVAVEPLIKELP